jgi:hypothetical protein
MARSTLNGNDIAALHAFVVASTDPAIVDARTRGATIELAALLNAAATPAVLAWRIDVQPSEADDAPNYANFDTIVAGKRESWGFFLNFPRDFSRNKVRKWITDVWGNATAGSDAEAILLAGTANATVAQNVIGGTVKTTGTVSATDLTYVGSVTQEDAQRILA